MKIAQRKTNLVSFQKSGNADAVILRQKLTESADSGGQIQWEIELDATNTYEKVHAKIRAAASKTEKKITAHVKQADGKAVFSAEFRG